MHKKVFRVFLSSTFSDFQAEREALRNRVWPEMEALCASRGAYFQAIDLRWGISPSAASSQETLDICLEEVRRCKSLSPKPKPNFILLVGNRYGWRPPASRIPEPDFKRLLEALAPDDFKLIQDIYRLDENAPTPERLLLSKDQISQMGIDWPEIEPKLVDILLKAAEACDLNSERYSYSATHQEILEGLFEQADPRDNILAILRGIRGLPESSKDEKAQAYSDYREDGDLDDSVKARLASLRESIKSAIPESQIIACEAEWKGTDSAPVSLDHLEDCCRSVEAFLRRRIEAELPDDRAESEIEQDQEEQTEFLWSRSRALRGRNPEISKALEYIHQAGNGNPCIIRGPEGSGKSSVLAGVLDAALKADDSGTCYYSFTGASPRSWSIKTCLSDLAIRISNDLKLDRSELPEFGNLRELSNWIFSHFGSDDEASAAIIIFDGVDQFVDFQTDGLEEVFPSRIPPSVRCILSAASGEWADRLVARYPEACILDLAPPSASERDDILEYYLQGRRLTGPQREAILKTAEKSGLPLWLRLAAQAARRLHSWDEPPRFPEDLDGMVRFILKDLENRHGPEFTRRCLRYIQYSRFGLSETELRAIAWKDVDIRSEFESRKSPDQPAVDSLPPILWSRLYFDLDPYLNEYWYDGQLLYKFFHKVFGRIASESSSQEKRDYHGRLADWFTSIPLYSGKVPNARKLMEEVYHLSLSGRGAEARRRTTDFAYAMAKCSLNRSDDWLEDFERSDSGSEDSVFNEWRGFARSRSHLLRRGDGGWTADKILLQTAVECGEESPVTKSAEAWISKGFCDWTWFRTVRPRGHLIPDSTLTIEVPKDDLERVFYQKNGAILGLSSSCLVFAWKASGKLEQTSRVIRDRLDLDGAECSGGALQFEDGQLAVLSSDGFSAFLLLVDSDLQSVRKIALRVGEPGGGTVLKSREALIWFNDGTLIQWDPKAGITRSVKAHSGSIRRAIEGARGEILSWASDKTLSIWIADGTLIPISREKAEYNLHDSSPGMVSLSDGRFVVWEDNDSPIGITVINPDGSLHQTWEVSGGYINRIIPGTEGTILVFIDDRIEQRNIEGRLIREYLGHEGIVIGGVLLPDGQLISWDTNKDIIRWTAEGHIKARSNSGLDLSFAPDCDIKLGLDNKILINNWSNLQVIDSSRIAANPGQAEAKIGVFGAYVLPNGNTVTYDQRGRLAIWDEHCNLIRDIDNVQIKIIAILELESGNFVTLCSSSIMLWDPRGDKLGEFQQSFGDYDLSIMAVSESSFIVSGPRNVWLFTEKLLMNGLLSKPRRWNPLVYSGGFTGMTDEGDFLIRRYGAADDDPDQYHLLDSHFNKIKSIQEVSEVSLRKSDGHSYDWILSKCGARLSSRDNFIELRKKDDNALICRWHPFSSCNPLHLYPDGRVLLSDGGYVRFLQLHAGIKELSLCTDGKMKG